MELNTVRQKVTRSQDFEENAFTINASAQAFKILSDGLYSNKIRAAIREICCNAWDAHIAAGNTDTEFEVTLPNNMNSIFKVRDYGTGLSHEDVMHLYTTYFASNKTDSNEATGGFGLGSKSPFAYTDNFDVISYYKGEKRSYSAIIAENGAPTINLLLTEKTDEPDGLEVAFPVGSYDVETFKREAQVALKPFKKKPKILGRDDLDFEETGEVMLRGSDWVVYKTQNRYGGDTNSVVRMGNVDYPFPMDNIADNHSSFLSTFRAVIEVPVGFIDPTPSRENLSMNKVGEVALCKKLDTIIQELVKEANEEVANCTSIWDARLMLRKLTGYQGHYQYIKDNIPWKWKGQEVLDTIHFNSDSWKKFRDKISIKEYSRKTNWKNDKAKVCLDERNYSFSPVENQEFILDDYDKKPDYKVRNYIRHHGDNDTNYVLIAASTKAALKKFLREVGISRKTLKPVTGLPLPPKTAATTRTRRPKGYESALLLKKGQGHYDKSSWWEKENVDFSKGGYYVSVKRWQGLDKGGYDHDIHPSSLLDVLNAVRDVIDIPTLYGVRAASVQKFKDDDNWINMYDAMKIKLEEIVKDEDLITYWNYENSIGVDLVVERYSSNQTVNNLRDFYKTWGSKLDSTKQFCIVMEEINEALNIDGKDKWEEAKKLRRYVKVDIDSSLSKVDIFKEANKIYEAYPMLKLIENTKGNMKNVDLLVDYINVIDKT